MNQRPVDASEVTDMVTSLTRLAVRLDPDAIPDHDIAGMLTDLGQAKRLIDGMVVLMARRTFDTTGKVGPAATANAKRQVAAAMGTTPGEAKKLLDTSVRLRDDDKIADAVRNGSLSDSQAQAVAEAAAAAPEKTDELLDAAANQSVQDLRKTCRDTKQDADPDPAGTRRRHHRTRTFRSWSESDGEWKGYLSGTADAGARIEAAIRGTHDQIFTTAYADGRQEDDGAYRFDALLAVLEGHQTPDITVTHIDTDTAKNTDTGTDADGGTDAEGNTDADTGADMPTTPSGQGPKDGGNGSGSSNGSGRSGGPEGRRSSTDRSGGRGAGRQTKVIVTINADALRRGYALTGETCEIAGVGRVPVEAVKELIPGAHIAYVISNAVDAAVVHLGRQVTAHQRTALQARGYECEVPDCRSSHLLEIDHIIDWAISKETRLDQLAWLCRQHHQQKSRGAYKLGGPPGHRQWTPTPTTGHRSAPAPPDAPAQPPEPAQSDEPTQSDTPTPSDTSAQSDAPAKRAGPAVQPSRTDDIVARLPGQVIRACGNPPPNNRPSTRPQLNRPQLNRHRLDRIAEKGWVVSTP